MLDHGVNASINASAHGPRISNGHESGQISKTLDVHPNGHGVGTYTHSDGTLDGGFTRGGKVFVGEWIQSNYRGYFAFILTSDTSFYGIWTNSQDGDGRPWTGTKKQ